MIKVLMPQNKEIYQIINNNDISDQVVVEMTMRVVVVAAEVVVVAIETMLVLVKWLCRGK